MSEHSALPKSPPEDSTAATEVHESSKISVSDLCARGRVQYGNKNFESAADLYSRATEIQAEINGEMNPENAEILFLYGRSLFKLGQSKSDVLGGAEGKKKKRKFSPKPSTAATEKEENSKNGSKKLLDSNTPETSASNNTPETEKRSLISDTKKPLFQFTGDENFEESEEDEAHAGDDREEEEDDDELAAAFDVLDLSRILFEKKLEPFKNADNKDILVGDLPTTRHNKERLADTHDLLAEISLENESLRFPSAVTDFRAALAYKQELYTEESSVVAEAHYKLSLALEFASMTSAADDDNEGREASSMELDMSLREEAVKEMEAAIKSTELKLQAKESELLKMDLPDDIEITQNQVAEVKDMLSELQTRLEELRGPPVDVKSVLFGPLIGERGILSNAVTNESPNKTATRIEEAKKTAVDVTDLVRKKSKAASLSFKEEEREKRKIEDFEGTLEEHNKKAKLGN
ncbi:NASP-related protein sim3 [Golovinomyces cichoracearum]|uniref:NASP-related protein sim3 n=1 Tax=Golovinomyces cichoracearum TaxID=62708 RepID=A0A420IAN0_9PEZI|nr:NASP-related protein sim3 [Golovinomyces cichoracearum]